MTLQQECLEAMEIAVLQLKSGSPAVAAQIFSSVIESIGSHTSVEYDELRALALCHLSQVHERLKQPEDARECREKAAAQLREIQVPGNTLAIEDRLANTLIDLGDYRRAIPFCEQAIKLAGKDALKVASRLWRAGSCYLRAGFKKQSEEPLRKALEIFRKEEEDPRTPVVLIDLGNALRTTNPQEAESHYREAAEIWERSGKLLQATTAWVNLGVLCSEQDRLSEALEWYGRARRVREADPATPPTRLGSLCNNIANLHRRLGDFDQAAHEVQSAIELLETQGDPILAEAYGTRALILRDQGADEDALAWFRKARAECEKQPSPDVTQLAEKIENEALLLARLGRAAEAAAVESELAQLRSTTPPAQKYEIGPLKRTTKSSEGAVLIELDGATLPSSTYENYDLATLENQLTARVDSEAVGELDGHEFELCSQAVTIFLYGADAEALFEAIEPVLRGYPLCEHARVTIRQGTSERLVIITGA
jgi:tetratricopeptide (TPR) repeat protein